MRVSKKLIDEFLEHGEKIELPEPVDVICYHLVDSSPFQSTLPMPYPLMTLPPLFFSIDQGINLFGDEASDYWH